MRTVLSLIISVLFFALCQSQDTDLSLQLEKDNEYKQVTNSTATVIQEFNGQEIQMVMEISGAVTFLVKDINENAYVMDTKIEKLAMSMQTPQGTVEFNSEKNNSDDIFSMILGSMKGKTFEITMSKSGKITKVKNIETLWGEAIEQFDHLPEAQKEQIRAQILNAYGAEAFRGNIEMVTAIYPDQPVKKGDKWFIDTKLETGMSAVMTTEFEFTDLTQEYAFIKGISSIETADKDAYIKANGLPLKYDLSGSMISEIKVDKSTGWIIEANINQEMKGNAYIKENPQLPEGLKIPMIMINETLITN